MTNKVSSQYIDTLHFLRELQSYLKTEMQIDGTKVTIKVKNTAPDNQDWPQVVFMGVGLSTDIGVRMPALPLRKQDKLGEHQKLDNPPWKNDTTYNSFLKINYRRIDGKVFPDVTSDEQQRGEVLFPGQSLVYEIDIPPEAIPYAHFRVEGTVSRRHLFHFQETVVMPEAYTKPPLLEALRAFNGIEVHKVLDSVITSMPNLGGETRLAELQTFVTNLSNVIGEVKVIQEAENNIFRKYKFPQLQAHLRAVFIYLDNLSKRLILMKEAIASSNPEKITAAAGELKAMKEMAAQLNRAIEEVMHNHNITDHEVNYKYRGR